MSPRHDFSRGPEKHYFLWIKPLDSGLEHAGMTKHKFKVLMKHDTRYNNTLWHGFSKRFKEQELKNRLLQNINRLNYNRFHPDILKII